DMKYCLGRYSYWVRRGDPWRLPADAKRKRKYLGGNLVVSSIVIPDLCIKLRMALAEAIRHASTNVAAECIRTSRSCYDLHASNRASVPPGPIGIADDAYSGRCGFT